MRAALVAVGALLIAYGAWLLLSRSSTAGVVATAVWLGGGVVVHDLLLAPLVIVIAWTVRRVLPSWWHGPLILGGIVLGSLTLLAVPVLGGWGREPDNPSLLNRDYWAGWAAVAGVVGSGVVAGALAVRWRERRR